MTKKEQAAKLKAEREKVLKVIHEAVPNFGATRILNIECSSIFIEGGTFPATYDRDTKQLFIWGRSSRNSGGSMAIDELIKLEAALKLWDEEQEKEEENV
ncbi:hypothetical protein BSK59_16125 [Paenibacillus odorifer]|uniref:hypothetical protein n=1 Tax=Paenibacillus odorifer TaxID=189426 RepID=UPI00096FD46D|nr:hypothetical protein [Paenibacillus odorifer]OME54106.1 hypothetical protein BSK59_16125 [Paenibacillus odorifer]